MIASRHVVSLLVLGLGTAVQAQSVVSTPARLDQSILPAIGGGSFGTHLNNAQFYPAYTSSFTNYYLNQNGWFFRVGDGSFPLYNGIWPLGSISLPNTFSQGATPNVGVYTFTNNGTGSGHFNATLTVTVDALGTTAGGLPKARLKQTLRISSTDSVPFSLNLFNVQSLPLQGVSSNTTWAATNVSPSTGAASEFGVTQAGSAAFANVRARDNSAWQLGRNSSTDSAGISKLFAPSSGSGTPGAVGLNLTNKSLVTNGFSQGPQTFGGSLAVQWSRTLEVGGTVEVTIETLFNAALPPPPCGPDLNADGAVNTVDLTLFLARFGQSGTPGSAGDFDGDGSVSTADLVVFLGFFGQSCGV